MKFINLNPDSNIVILTGAGISKESGLDTFRDSDGIWKKYNLEDIATYDGFLRNPNLVHEFYNQRRSELILKSVKANSAHTAIAKLQKLWRGSCYLITQNIDNLHEQAGTTQVLHMHGELTFVSCIICLKSTYWDKDCNIKSICKNCSNVGSLRPKVVWFGEEPIGLVEIEQKLHDCNLYIAIGTSGEVYPASAFCQAIPLDSQSIEINTKPTRVTDIFSNTIKGNASESVPIIVNEILSYCNLKDE